MDGRRITIGGKHWRLVYVAMRNTDGSCDAPDATGKTIRIARRLKRYPRALAETLVHEIVHACLWPLSEEAVEQAAIDIVRLLEQEGLLKT